MGKFDILLQLCLIVSVIRLKYSLSAWVYLSVCGTVVDEFSLNFQLVNQSIYIDLYSASSVRLS